MNYNNQYNETVSVGEWIGTMFLMMIPLVNIILVFVWAFGSAKPSKRNYFRASLLMSLIFTGIGVLAGIVLFATGALATLLPSLTGFYF